MRAAPITNSTTAPIQDQNSGAGMPRFFKYPAKPVTFHSFPPMPPELARNSQPSRTRPTRKKASAVPLAMLSVCDSNGCDDSVDWMDMISPSTLRPSLARSSPDGRRLRPFGEDYAASLLIRTIREKGQHCGSTWAGHVVEGVIALHYGASPSNGGGFE